MGAFNTRNLSGLCEKYGIFGVGELEGSQAEYVLIPEADLFCLPIPGSLKEEDVILDEKDR